MEADGLLVSTKETIDGRVLRVYRATPAGREALADGRRAVQEVASEMLRDQPGRTTDDDL